jgi:AcrR family transcriptional regulator/DNA-binding MarR family transcriptional regulator
MPVRHGAPSTTNGRAPQTLNHDHRTPGALSDNGAGGRHERVVEIQRGRILAAMAQAASEHGAANVTVAHVVACAGVSRRTFYEVFGDIEDCFLGAFDEALARAGRYVLDGYEQSGGWTGRMRSALIGFLRFLDEDPFMGRLLVVESLAAGAGVLDRRRRILAHVIRAVGEGGAKQTRSTSKPSLLPPLTAEGVVGGVLGVLHARLCEPSPAGGLLELAGPLMGMIVLPYQGAAAARRELDRPSPKTTTTTTIGSQRNTMSTSPLSGLHMRLTYRTIRVLGALAANPGSSNRRVAEASEITDQGQMSKLLARLQQLGLIQNTNPNNTSRGEPNAWTLTNHGWEIQSTLAKDTNT